MFNALNRFMSRLDGDTSQREQEKGSFGFQVLRNTNLELSIQPWFEYIVGINGRPIALSQENPDPSLLAQEIRNCAGGSVSLGLWSAKGQRTREIHVEVPIDTASLGLSLQYAPLALAANIWHVLDVPANSPADLAGLLPYSDYILGSPEASMHGEGALGEIVEDYIGRPLRLYIYNNEYDVTREVTITPSRQWGGEGAIGCTLGYGALHRIPAPLSEPVDGPGETMFNGESTRPLDLGFVPAASATATPPPPPPPAAASSATPVTSGTPVAEPNFLVPAQLVDSATGSRPPSAPPKGNAPPRAAQKKERNAATHDLFVDDYFKEEEAKSKKLDNAPHAQPAAAPPPSGGPPMGGPPRGGPPRATSATPGN
ncbi:hypothetical protein Golomagni_06580 [Golovinomyces magnicellulatus]|nr:hypothetical protein Golomagni_06580 [Golovinomyces magnicellulatus]